MSNPLTLQQQRERRRKNSNLDTRTYEKSPKGFLMRTYRNMLSRVTGIQYKKAHLYKGLDILPKEDFYTWALNDPSFQTLFSTWTGLGFPRKETPSINRIDTHYGYRLENMEWLTHSQNSRLGNLSRPHKKDENVTA